MEKLRRFRSFEPAELLERLMKDFSGLDRNDPSRWPAVPRYLLLLVLLLAVVAGLWYAWLRSLSGELDAERRQEAELRETYKAKVAQAVNLDALKLQLQQVQIHVKQLEKQLPSKAEMDALLSDINQSGLGRSLEFDLFRPGSVVLQEYYAEQAIGLKVNGSYHDLALFAADIAALSRIVTLNNLTITPAAGKSAQPGQLTLEATAKTFRYLDPDEALAQKAPRQKEDQP